MSTATFSQPLYVENLSPLAGLIAIPAPIEPPIHEGISADLNFAVASHWVNEDNGAEAVFFDGETQRHSLHLEYGINSDWAVSLTLPYVSHDSGFLDGLINNWHDAFGLSDGGRALYPEDQFSYRFTTPNHAFDLNESSNGIGDVRLAVRNVWYRNNSSQVGWRLGYQFATGDEDKLLGAGVGQAFGELHFSGAHLSDLPLTWHGRIGATYSGDIDSIGPDQNNVLWYAGLSGDWRLTERWSLLAQIDSHAAIADGEIDAVGSMAAMLSLGARYRFTPQWTVDLSFIEDIAVETAPDVTFQATLSYRPE